MNNEGAPEVEPLTIKVGDKTFTMGETVTVVRDNGNGPVEKDWKMLAYDPRSSGENVLLYKGEGDEALYKSIKVADFLSWQEKAE